MGENLKAFEDDSESRSHVKTSTLSRREFIKIAGIAGAAVGLGGGLGGLVAACGGAEEMVTTSAAVQTTGGASTSEASSTSVSASAEKGAELKIGFVSPLTGALAAFGVPDKYHVERWREAVGDGLVLGDGKMHRITFDAQDTQSDSNRAATVAGDLIHNAGIQLMLVASTPDTVKPVVDQCEAGETPCFSTDCPWQTFLGKSFDTGYKWCYHFFWGNEDFMAINVSVYNKLSTNKVVGYMLPNDAAGNAYRPFLPPYLTSAGFKAVDGGAFDNGQEDYTTVIASFKGQGVEIVTGVMNPGDFTNFWQQASQQSFFPKACLMSKAILFPQSVNALGGIADGLLTELWWHPSYNFKSSLTGDTCAAYAEDFTARTGNQPTAPLLHHVLGEMAVFALKNAANPEDRASIIESVAKMKFDSIAGPIDFSAPVMAQKADNHVAFDPGPGHKRPNVYDPGLGGAQWLLSTGGKWKFEESIVDNSAAPFVTAKLADPKPLARKS